MPKVLRPLLTVTAIASLVAFAFNQEPNAPTAEVKETPPAEQAVIQPVTDDSISQPPVRQTFASGSYQLIISAEDSWETPLTVGKFYQGSQLLWQKDLPHQYGPRFALISKEGQVLLLDEFINVASPHALTLISPDGEIIRKNSFGDIHKALDIHPTTLTEQATDGWWISAPPVLSAKGDHALVATGGTTLEIDLKTGKLRRHTDLDL